MLFFDKKPERMCKIERIYLSHCTGAIRLYLQSRGTTLLIRKEIPRDEVLEILSFSFLFADCKSTLSRKWDARIKWSPASAVIVLSGEMRSDSGPQPPLHCRAAPAALPQTLQLEMDRGKKGAAVARVSVGFSYLELCKSKGLPSPGAK